MMLCLSTCAGPDIAFAVSQVARFSHNPKKSHAAGVKMIVQHLPSLLRPWMPVVMPTLLVSVAVTQAMS
jgi:hypothetical protein